MAVATDAYKQGMRQLAASVTIITTVHDGRRLGLTATSVCSLTADPPVLLVCINRQAGAHDPIVESGRFCVNVLAEEHAALSHRFAGAETGETRFAAGSWGSLATGSPVLLDSLTSFDCLLARTIEAGTHTIFFGAVEAVQTHPHRRPLLYADGAYGGLAALEAVLAGRD